MKSFIIQFKKAKDKGMRLIYDGVNERYLITHNVNWQRIQKHTLITNFNDTH